MSEQMDLQVVDDQQSQMTMLIKMAVSNNLDTDKLSKLIELKNQEEQRQCKKDFDYHFAQMQREFKPVKKAKAGYGYNYAPLELLQKEYGQTIADHGFAYRWREEPIDGGSKRIILIISGHGHTDESTSFDIPPLEGTKQQNKAQVLGSMTTYGKRYTFMSGFGIIVEDEDDDGASFEDGIHYAKKVSLIRGANSMDELKAVFTKLYHEMGNDQAGKQILSSEKDKRKKELASG